MRLWHKDLIPYLPRQQLLGQWRECCLIAKSIAENGTPNHLLVNKIMDYSPSHFFRYCALVREEMKKRGYKVNWRALEHWRDMMYFDEVIEKPVPYDELFSGWHDQEYFWICYYNLREKYICGGITQEEWKALEYAACKAG